MVGTLFFVYRMVIMSLFRMTHQMITDYNIIQNALNNFNIDLSEILAFDCVGITH